MLETSSTHGLSQAYHTNHMHTRKSTVQDNNIKIRGNEKRGTVEDVMTAVWLSVLRSSTETVEGAAGTLEGVHDVQGSNGLPRKRIAVRQTSQNNMRCTGFTSSRAQCR